MATPTNQVAKAPWAYIAHKDGYWVRITSAELPREQLSECIGSSVLDGFSVMTVYSREEYTAELAKLKSWHESPEWKMKHAEAVHAD